MTTLYEDKLYRTWKHEVYADIDRWWIECDGKWQLATDPNTNGNFEKLELTEIKHDDRN